MTPTESNGKPWRVYRYERADGNYCELASNHAGPNQIPTPPGYKFVRATTLVEVNPQRSGLSPRARALTGLTAAVLVAVEAGLAPDFIARTVAGDLDFTESEKSRRKDTA